MRATRKAMTQAADRPAERHTCGHWDGDAEQVCGSQTGVRRFIQGYRCHLHNPDALKAGAA